MATSSIGETVRLNKKTGRKMAKSLKHPAKRLELDGSIKSGRIIKDTSIKLK